MTRHRTCISLLLILIAATLLPAWTQTSQRRRMTPVETPATVTQNINEALTDSTRILEARKARSTQFQNADGRTVYVDTITGEQWIDSTALRTVVKMKYPLLESASVGVDIWDPLMRAFGQDYGLVGAWAEVSLHNRYFPVIEAGLGKASHTPSENNYTYRSPLSVYFRIGLNYNFLYNSSPDYRFFAGVRYGFSPFSYSITDITVNSPYWDETARFDIPSRKSTAGWFELVFGLRVKLWGPISAGWSIKYHTILHESSAPCGQPWYIPGYGSRSGALTGSFSISYTIGLDKSSKDKPLPGADADADADLLPPPEDNAAFPHSSQAPAGDIPSPEPSSAPAGD